MSDFYDLYYREPHGLSPEDFDGLEAWCTKCTNAWLDECVCQES